MDRATLSGLDSDGFATVERLRIQARRGEAEFALVYPVPALLLEITAEATDRVQRAVGDRERSFARTAAASLDEVDAAEPGDIARYVGRVVFLAKRPGNPFPEMITVGRALNNDIAFVIGSISKVHGYFRQEPGRWSFTDQRSRNGTSHGGRRLASGVAVVLQDGDRLEFGPDIACTFLLPVSLARRLTGAPAP